MTRTREEIFRLKDEWRADPIWDLETTEGFEEHRAELLAYREEMQLRWAKERLNAVYAKAEAIGCPNNLALARYVMGLERQIAELREKLDLLPA